jgi:hypothetical protein
MASQAVQTTLKVDVTESEQIEANRSPDSPPLASAYNIRRSLSPLLDFGRPGSSLGGERRNFCNISECAFCKPLTDNHRLLSPLRSPVISPSSRFQIPFFFVFSSVKENSLVKEIRRKFIINCAAAAVGILIREIL